MSGPEDRDQDEGGDDGDDGLGSYREAAESQERTRIAVIRIRRETLDDGENDY